MATVPARGTSNEGTDATVPSRSKRRNTSHLKLVPETLELREKLRTRCQEVAARLEKSVPLTKDEMERAALALLDEMGLGEGYVGWTMVVLAGAFWQDQVACVEPSRRLFLLPHCLKHAEGCPADYDDFGLDCEKCGACSIADFRSQAEQMGYRVLVAEGSPIVLKVIVSGYVDAIIGVACLNVLEKAIDKILLAGIPCVAVPLLSSDCRNTSVDESWVREMLNLTPPKSAKRTRSYVHLMRSAASLFDPDELERLVPRMRGGPRLSDVGDWDELDPVSATEAVAYDFLGKGGKYARPFITLAVHDALSGSLGTEPGGADHLSATSLDAVKRAAMSIEAFHKASLVHDDIEDDDNYRYGDATLHRKFGTATAINVGDYLIGLGYRLVSQETQNLGAEKTADILHGLADAHLRLSEGQGAELAWRDSRQKRLSPLDALKIYVLKTAPAFEAAMYTGARLAGPAKDYLPAIRGFARNLGVAFQILNDLKDWREDSSNKMHSGGDVLGGRPTLLWALALENLPDAERTELLDLVGHPETDGGDSTVRARLARVGQLYDQADVFSQARRLVDKHRERAEAIADELQPDELRRLLYYMIDTILEAESVGATPQVVMTSDQLTQSIQLSASER